MLCRCCVSAAYVSTNQSVAGEREGARLISQILVPSSRCRHFFALFPDHTLKQSSSPLPDRTSSGLLWPPLSFSLSSWWECMQLVRKFTIGVAVWWCCGRVEGKRTRLAKGSPVRLQAQCETISVSISHNQCAKARSGSGVIGGHQGHLLPCPT